jgi:hypothetical protein
MAGSCARGGEPGHVQRRAGARAGCIDGELAQHVVAVELGNQLWLASYQRVVLLPLASMLCTRLPDGVVDRLLVGRTPA